MDAVKFIKESKRLCKAQESCGKCVVKIGGCCLTDIFVEENSAEKTVAVVEQWSKDNPVKTRQSEFLKMFPHAQKQGGIINICPICIDSDYNTTSECLKTACDVCRERFWNEEISE